MALSESDLLTRRLARNAPDMNLAQFLSGDVRAFEETYPRLVSFATQYMNGQEGAEDLVQTVFAAAVRPLREKAPSEFDDVGGSVLPYLYRSIVNTRINQVRKDKRRVGTTIDMGDMPERLLRDPGQDVEGDVVGELAYCETVARIRRSVGEVFVDALCLSGVDGLPNRQVAERQGVPLGTAQSRISRGKSKARKALK